jgi:Ras family
MLNCHLGVNFMEKTISIRNTEITFSIWDLGGQREFVNMLPLVCNDAVAILFMFDLTRKSTLNSIKEWYRQGRGFNKTAIPFLVGTKYDTFVNFPVEEQEEISNQARRFAKAMKASLIFSSTSHGINVQKVPSSSIPVSQHSNSPSDLQNRSLQSFRPPMHYSRNRKRRRTTSPVSDCVEYNFPEKTEVILSTISLKFLTRRRRTRSYLIVHEEKWLPKLSISLFDTAVTPNLSKPNQKADICIQLL